MPEEIPTDPSPQREPLKPLRLTMILGKLLNDNFAGKVNALTAKIAAANKGTAAEGAINWHKVEQVIKHPEQMSLSLAQLNALHNYLASCNIGEGLDEKPLFDRMGVLTRVAECGQVTCLVGAYPRPPQRHNDVSLWDTRCVARFVQETGRLRPGTSFTIKDVLWSDNVTTLYQSTAELIAGLDQRPCSVISIGSPRACIGSEVLLSLMLGPSPLTKSRPRPDKPLEAPFYFVWSPKLTGDFQSAFALTGQDLLDLGHEAIGQQVLADKSTAFIYDKNEKNVMEIPLEAERWTMAGIIVAQRRRRGNVLVVVAGNSGPATLASAFELVRLQAVLPFHSGEDGPVLFAPVWADVRVDRSPANVGDWRDLKDSGLLADAAIWPKPARTPGPTRPG